MKESEAGATSPASRPARSSSSPSWARSRSTAPPTWPAQTGVTIDEARRLWRALGFPDRGLEVAFTAADADAVSTLVGQVEAGLIDFDMAVTLTRAVGQTMAKLADWEVATLVHRVQEIEAGERGDRQPGHAPGCTSSRR